MNEGASSTACASCRLTCGCVHVFDRSCLMCGRVVIRMSSSNLYTRSALREPARAVNNSAARRRAVQVHRTGHALGSVRGRTRQRPHAHRDASARGTRRDAPCNTI